MTEQTSEWAGLAVDIGNSKADVAVVSADGQQISWVRTGTITPQRLGWDGCASAIVRCLDAAAHADGTVVRAVYAAVAGVDFPDEEEQLSIALARTGRFEEVIVRNDAYALLASGEGLNEGVCVVAGAGMNCVGVHAGRHVRFAALGEISGDWGGGRDVALAGLAAACRAQDGRGCDTLLARSVPDLFGVESALDVTGLLHRGDLAITDVLPITELVFAAARGGDKAAMAIITRQAEEVAAFVRAAHVRLGLPIGAVPIVLGGSLLRLGGPVIHDAIAAQLLSDAPPIVVPGQPPIVGAVAGVTEMLGLNLRVHELEVRLGQPRSAEGARDAH